MNNFYVCLALLAVAFSAVFAAGTPSTAKCPERDECFTDLKKYQNSASLKEFCSAINSTGNCFKDLEQKCKGANITHDSDEAIDKIDETELKDGCFGKCASKAGDCLQTVMASLNYKTKYSMDLCKKIATATKCLEGLSSDKSCKPKTAKLIFYMSKSFKENDFGDICNNKGDTTKCFTEFNACTDDLRTNRQTGVEKACKQIDKYLECTSEIDSCKGRIEKMKAYTNKYVESLETKGQCPITGTCNDRMDRCVNNTQTALDSYEKNPSSKDKKKVCSDLKQANKCFVTVRKDQTCTLKSGAIDNMIAKGKKLYSDECDAASSVIISTALMMLGLAVSLFKNI